MSEHRLSKIVIHRPYGERKISLRKLPGFKKELNKITKEASEDGLFNPYLIKIRRKSYYSSQHFGPLRRFLRSKVGQHWDEVYSEMCQRLGRNTIARQYVISDVWTYVERHVEIINGSFYSKPKRGYAIPLDGSYCLCFYVHPETGILCTVENIPRKQTQTQQETDVVIIDRYHQYQKLNDIWYLITFEDFPPPPTNYVQDILKGFIHYSRADTYRDCRIYAVKKQQCSKKQIRFILNQLSEN